MTQTKVKQKIDVKGYMSNFFSKLSRGLMLPIAMLPVAGLFLGVGAGVSNVIIQIMNPDFLDLAANPELADKIAKATWFTDSLASIGDIIFGNLPTLFCLGVAIAFAEEAGVAVFAAFIGWIVFNATQSTMIWDGGISAETGRQLYNIGFYKAIPDSVVGVNVGIQSMQTSVFGGITIGLFVAFLYNKFHTIQLPNVIGFFSGSRFVPIITFLTVPLWGIGFILVWPLFGLGLNALGVALAGMPFGTDAFIFGVIERSLIPFGLHHAFYTPLWYTSAGGTLTQIAADGSATIVGEGNQGIWFAMQSSGIPFNLVQVKEGAEMTQNGWTAVWTTGSSVIDITKDSMHYQLTAGINPGAYMQGKFPIMLFGLPAAGVAMIMAAKKENRQVAMSVIGAAAITSFLTGITEPIEFTFLFLAPYLYYGFHIWMAGFSFMFLDIMNSHIGMTFSGGIFDYFLFGLLPSWTGFHTNPYWVLLIGAAYVPAYYFVFYFAITKFDVKTPGRADGDVVMVSKADYKAAKGTDAKAPKADKGGSYLTDPKWTARADELLVKLGGMDNLKSIAACITRLRIDVKDPEIVDYDGIVAMGASGCVGKGKTSQQHIFGAEADKFKTYFLSKR